MLLALKNEGMTDEAAEVEAIMRNRTLVGVTNQCRYYVVNGTIRDLGNTRPGCHWYLEANITTPWVNQTGLPGAGSEFAWDTTGQEEAYIWGDYFGRSDLAASALNQILAHTPLVPNFAWHGSAFGEGDFGNNGAIDGGHERVLQHYRSGLNAIPTTEAFLKEPSDLYLLRLAAGSVSGVLTNIDQDGAPSMGFHADPSLLRFDPASGDHGLAFYGHSHITQSFLVFDPIVARWCCYFCNLRSDADHSAQTAGASGTVAAMSVTPRDSYRRKVFIAALGLQIVSDAGTVARVELAATPEGAVNGNKLSVIFNPVGKQPLSRFRLRLISTTTGTTRFVAPVRERFLSNPAL